MGSGSLHQWVAWGAVAIIVLIIYLAVAEEKIRDSDDLGHEKKKRPYRAEVHSPDPLDVPPLNAKRSSADQEEKARIYAHAKPSKVLMPPPEEKRIEGVAPRKNGRLR